MKICNNAQYCCYGNIYYQNVCGYNDNLEQDIFINKISQYTGIEKSTLLSLVKKNIDKEEYQMTQKAFFEKNIQHGSRL